MVIEYISASGNNRRLKYVCPINPISSVSGKTTEVTIGGTTYTVYNSCIYGNYSLDGVLLFDQETYIEKYSYYSNDWHLSETFQINYHDHNIYAYSSISYSTVTALHILNTEISTPRYSSIFENFSQMISCEGVEQVNFYESFEYCTTPLTPTTATVRVTCNIPKEPDYKYIKLTYKKDTRPDSWEDGSSIDITKNAVTIDIPGLDIGSKYWFTIFSDISESESFPFGIDTVEDPVPPEIKPYIEWINGSGNLFKKLTYNQNSINSYTYQGTTYYHKINIDPKQTSFLQKVYAMDYDTSSVTKWGVENYTYQGYTGIYYNRASSVNQLLTLEINSAETEGLYTLSIPQLTMSYLTSTDMVPDLLITQNGEFYKISGTTSGYDTQRSKTVTSNLEGIFKFIWHHFHNVNIKVNGTYWSKVN